MRSLLTSGIKAILAVAALSTGIHWALRLQRDSDGLTTPAIASIADPEMTGSISPRASAPPPPPPAAETRQAVAPAPEAPAPLASRPAQARAPQPPALDQSHLAALIATATAPKKTAKR